MKKTTVYLEPDLDRAMGGLAERAGLTKAEAIRRALRSAVQAESVRPRIRAIGLDGGDGPTDTADAVDRHLREAGFGET